MWHVWGLSWATGLSLAPDLPMSITIVLGQALIEVCRAILERLDFTHPLRVRAIFGTEKYTELLYIHEVCI